MFDWLKFNKLSRFLLSSYAYLNSTGQPHGYIQWNFIHSMQSLQILSQFILS